MPIAEQRGYHTTYYWANSHWFFWGLLSNLILIELNNQKLFASSDEDILVFQFIKTLR